MRVRERERGLVGSIISREMKGGQREEDKLEEGEGKGLDGDLFSNYKKEGEKRR